MIATFYNNLLNLILQSPFDRWWNWGSAEFKHVPGVMQLQSSSPLRLVSASHDFTPAALSSIVNTQSPKALSKVKFLFLSSLRSRWLLLSEWKCTGRNRSPKTNTAESYFQLCLGAAWGQRRKIAAAMLPCGSQASKRPPNKSSTRQTSSLAQSNCSLMYKIYESEIS